MNRIKNPNKNLIGSRASGPALAGRHSWVMHVDVDAFFVSVEEVLDPSLRGKAVVVGGDPAGRGVVAAASYKAREFGIHSALPLAHAKRLCPHAIFLRGDPGRYAEFSARIMDIFRRYSPRVEPVSLDEAYLDLTGCERMHHASVFGIGARIREEIRSRVGVNASIGIAANRLVAKVASDEAKPNGMLWIARGREREFLAPLPIRKMPGIGEKSGKTFVEMGIRRIGDLTRFPPDLLEKAFGQSGLLLYRRAHGEDETPVAEEDRPPKSIGKETTFQRDTVDPEYLERVIGRLVERIGEKLRNEGLSARCVTLKLRYSDFRTYTRSHTLPAPTDLDAVIFSAAAGLFRALFVRRTRVRLIGVGLSSLVRQAHDGERSRTIRPSGRQLDLFEESRLRKLRLLYAGLDRIRARYGSGAVFTGRTFLSLRSEILDVADTSIQVAEKGGKIRKQQTKQIDPNGSAVFQEGR